MPGTCAIVVTYNRKDLLRECLAALADQTQKPDRILVVDNASTDGTREMLESEYRDVEVLALPQNEGGAGGFHEGMKRAHADGFEWLWLMDDDTIPNPDALAQLLDALGRVDQRPAFLASRVVWTDGRIHPMNALWPDRRRVAKAIEATERGLMRIRLATFVSLLVHRGVIDRHGLPFKQFFIWSDDIEYTSRVVLSGEEGYCVPTSVALHKTATAHTSIEAPPDRFYFHVRNTLFIARGPGRNWRDRLVRLGILGLTVAQYLAEHPSREAAAAIGRGLRDGLRSAPPRLAQSRSTGSP